MNRSSSNALNFTQFLATHRPSASATMVGSPTYPNLTGRILFYPLNDRYTVVVSRFEGLPVGVEECNNRFFALHIHDGDACTGNAVDPFADAGSHDNPDGCPHPSHAGDLPPILGTAYGVSWSAVLTDRFSVREVLEKPVVLHRNSYDFRTQPAGNAGKKIACGIIRKLYH